jgi:hypothetical protein
VQLSLGLALGVGESVESDLPLRHLLEVSLPLTCKSLTRHSRLCALNTVEGWALCEPWPLTLALSGQLPKLGSTHTLQRHQ